MLSILAIILCVAQYARYTVCCAMHLVFYMLLDKFDILWVTQCMDLGIAEVGEIGRSDAAWPGKQTLNILAIVT